MNLWAVTMVRDELDILPFTLQHLIREGVDGIIVADNMSTDGTWEYLSRLNPDCEFVLLRDHEVGYYQSRKMTTLARTAFDAGADWVIPFDADELWFNSVQDKSLWATLHTYAQATGCLQVALHNYFPTSTDPEETNPFLRITHRDPEPAPLPKVIVRNDPSLFIAQGNHDAAGSGSYPRHRSVIEIAHFPWRSPAQFLRKVANGNEAYRATDLPEAEGAHWRNYGQLLLDRGPLALIGVYEEWFSDPPMELQVRPAPWGRNYKV